MWFEVKTGQLLLPSRTGGQILIPFQEIGCVVDLPDGIGSIITLRSGKEVQCSCTAASIFKALGEKK